MSKKKQIALTIVLGLGVIVIFGFTKYTKIAKAIAEGKSFMPPPAAITTVVVEESRWDAVVSSVGSLVPVQGVTVTAEEAGRVVKIHAESGQSVPESAPLFDLDTSVEEANLRAAIANAERASSALKRAETLRQANANSISDLEAAQAAARATQAQVESIRAVIRKKQIVAPFAGRLGIRQVNIGQYVTPGTPLVPLHALQSVYLNYSLPQQYLTAIAIGQRVQVGVDAYPGRTFEGTVTAINPQVSESTRNVLVQATLTNPDEALRSGMFAEVTHILSTARTVLAVPSTSISYAPYGDTVYVVETKKDASGQEIAEVRQQVVKLGERRGDFVAVESGLQAGSVIASSGTFKLRPGARVVVNNSITPKMSTSPTPADS